MDHYTISASSESDDLIPFAIAFHEIVGNLPITARSRDRPGIRIENGIVVDAAYTGPVLEEVLRTNTTVRTTPQTGAYKGVPVTVSPIRDSNGEAIVSIGLVDITGIFDLATLMKHQSMILQQVCGKDPCPLPGEQINAKR